MPNQFQKNTGFSNSGNILTVVSALCYLAVMLRAISCIIFVS